MRRKTVAPVAVASEQSFFGAEGERKPFGIRSACVLVCVLWMAFLLISLSLPLFSASSPSITTTLQDQAVQRGSRKTFDVWARNGQGKKITATVKFNGQTLDPTWDDSEKASYTLHFTQAGENVVSVSASSDGGKKKELTYHITYQPAQTGEVIGSAVWSVELFSVNCGYLIPPTEMPIYEGETSADQLIRLLEENGYCAYYGGSTTASFYLAYVANGDSAYTNFSGYRRGGAPSSPRHLDITPSISQSLMQHLERTMTTLEPNDYADNWQGYLGEFVFTNGSGWMYTLNNRFPNVGFADSFLSDGDVVRVQFTLGYGADIGGFGSMGTTIPGVDSQPSGDYYAVADKDALTVALCRAASSGLLSYYNVKQAYDTAVAAAQELAASQNTVDAALRALNSALAHPSDAGNDPVPDTQPVTAPSTVEETPSGSSSVSHVTEPQTTVIQPVTSYRPAASEPDSGKSDTDAAPEPSETSTEGAAEPVSSGADSQTDPRTGESSADPESTVRTDASSAQSDSGEGVAERSTGRYAVIGVVVAVVLMGGAVPLVLKFRERKRKS